MTIEGSRGYHPAIDAVRFMSALMVAFFHLGFASWSMQGGSSRAMNGAFALPEASAISFAGWVGVQIFFVISGFVIAQSAEGRSPAAFAKGRFYRLYPAAWICASITMIFAAWQGTVNGNPLAAYVRSMLLLPLGPWVDTSYWTLGCEIVFYGLVYLLLLARGYRHLRTFACTMAAASAVYIACLASGIPGAEYFIKGFGRIIPLYYGCFFAAGMLTYLWGIGRLGRTGGVFLLVSLLAAGAQIVKVNAINALAAGDAFPAASLWFVPLLLFFAAYGTIALSAVRTIRFGAPLESRLRAIGLATYPLYLVHLTVGIMIMRGLHVLGVPPFGAFLLAIVLIVILAVFIAERLEPPLRNALRGIVERRSALRAPSAAEAAA